MSANDLPISFAASGTIDAPVDNPAIRNSWTRVAMRRIRSFQPDDRNRVLDKISRATQNTIARIRADDWLPAALAVEVCDALAEALGSERAVEFWRDVVYDSWVGGLLEPLLAKSGDSGEGRKHGLLTLAPAAWSLSARDCGQVVLVDDVEGRVKLEARGLPPAVRQSLGIQVMYAGALQAMLAFSRLSASVEILAEGDQPLAFRLKF
jgi:hypothetical protein